MNQLVCPRCRSVPSYTWGFALQKPYCTGCGWNCDVVARQARGNVRSLGAASVVLAAVAAALPWQVGDEPGRMLGATVGLIALIGAAFTLLEYLQWRRLRARPAPPSPAPEPHPEMEAALVGRVWQVQSLARPRRVRMRGRIRRRLLLALVLLAAGASLLVWAARAEKPDAAENRATPALWMAIAAIYLLGAPRHLARDRRLLASGEATLGRVTEQGGVWEPARVRYRFRDAAGEEHAGECPDPYGAAFEEMPVIVFYDPQDPRRSVPLECAAYEIMAPL